MIPWPFPFLSKNTFCRAETLCYRFGLWIYTHHGLLVRHCLWYSCWPVLPLFCSSLTPSSQRDGIVIIFYHPMYLNPDYCITEGNSFYFCILYEVKHLKDKYQKRLDKHEPPWNFPFLQKFKFYHTWMKRILRFISCNIYECEESCWSYGRTGLIFRSIL